MEINRIKEKLTEGLIKYDSESLNENILSDIKNYARKLARKIFKTEGGDENEIESQIEDDIISKLPNDVDVNSDLDDVLRDEEGESNIEWPEPEEIVDEPKQQPVEPTDINKGVGKPNTPSDNQQVGTSVNNIEVSEEIINKIIENNYRVKILYQGKKEDKPNWRFIDIYAIGTSKAGNRVIRGYQAFGYTETAIPKWKLFRIDRILQIQITKYHYGKSPMDLYNPNGDGSMISVSNKKQF